MLKIKENIDLKELEKYGLELYEYEEEGLKYIYYNFPGCTTNRILILDEIDDDVERAFYFDDVLTDEEADILYDLVKADLVEKV